MFHIWVGLDLLTGAGAGVAPPPPEPTNTALGGGGSSIHWRVAAKQRRKLEEAIRAALRGDEPVAEAAVEVATEVATEVQRDWTLPQPADFSSEAAHIAALTAEVERISVAIAMQNRRQAEDLQRRRVAKAKALAAKVRKVLRLVDLADAA